MITFKDIDGNEWITSKNNILLSIPKFKASLPSIIFLNANTDDIEVFVSWELLDTIKKELLK